MAFANPFTHLPFMNAFPMTGAMSDAIMVSHGAGMFPVSASVIETHFPGLMPFVIQHGILDLRKLARHLFRDIGIWPIHPRYIQKILRTLFGLFKNDRIIFHGFHRSVLFHLKQLYGQVTLMPIRDRLQNIRKRFYVLAVLARLTMSSDLAHVLMEFWTMRYREIAHIDHTPRDWTMWAAALMELREFVPFPDLQAALGYMEPHRHKILSYYNDMGFRHPRLDFLSDFWGGVDGFRGRGRMRGLIGGDMLGIPYMGGARARTLPPMAGRHPNLIMPSITDAMALQPYPSPTLSLDGALGGGYMGAPLEAEIDNLHMRQQMLEQEVGMMKMEMGTVW